MTTLFITGTGTNAGKTWVTRGLARALTRAGRRVAALKPVETGCVDGPADARALGLACGQPTLADAPGFYRVPPPLSPYAATLAGQPPPPSVERLVHAIRRIDADVRLVEGAGGVLVPLSREHTLADLADALGAPVLLVAADALGVLSSVLTAVESLRARQLDLAAVVLTRHGPLADPSRAHNARILRERLGPLPVCVVPPANDDDEALADAVETAGLLDAMRLLLVSS